jgi:hypothetical protein
MKNQSSIFLLFGIIDYEGEATLGAYTSYDAAVLALDTYKAEVAVDRYSGRYDHTDYDDYSIKETMIDVPAIG